MAPGKKHASLFHDWEKQYGGAGILLVPTLFRKQVIIRYASLNIYRRQNEADGGRVHPLVMPKQLRLCSRSAAQTTRGELWVWSRPKCPYSR